MQGQLAKIENEDLGKFHEGWSTDGLAGSFINVFDLFKAKYRVIHN